MHDAQMHEDIASNIWRVLQRSKELDQGALSHPNGTSAWSECLMRSETRVGRIRTEDAHRQGGKSIKSINHMLQQLIIFQSNLV